MCSGLIVSIAANAAEGRRTETVSRFAPAGPGPGAAAATPSAQTGRQTATTRPQRIVCFFIIERILTDKESLVAPKPQNTAPKVTPAHALQTTAPLRERLRSVGQTESPSADGTSFVTPRYAADEKVIVKDFRVLLRVCSHLKQLQVQ